MLKNIAVITAFLLCTLSICAADAVLHVLAKDKRFVVVRLQAQQTYQNVALSLLGDKDAAWQITELNGPNTGRGKVIAVPLQPVNSSSVFVDGYRTIPILCYHQFSPGSKTRQELEISAQAFEQQLVYLKNNQFNVLSFHDVEKIISEHAPIPDKAVILTIDDGYKSVYDIAYPLLKKHGLKATLFIYTDFIGGSAALSWEQMKTMLNSDLIEIQSHGKSHTSLSRISDDSSDTVYRKRVLMEVQQSTDLFKKKLGFSPDYISYPYGNSSDTLTNVLQQQGYKVGATVTQGENLVFSNPYLLHRTMIYAKHDLDDFKKFITSFKSKSLK